MTVLERQGAAPVKPQAPLPQPGSEKKDPYAVFQLTEDIRLLREPNTMHKLRFPSKREVDRSKALRVAFKGMGGDSAEDPVAASCLYRLAESMMTRQEKLLSMRCNDDSTLGDDETIVTPGMLLIRALRIDSQLLSAWFLLAEWMEPWDSQYIVNIAAKRLSKIDVRDRANSQVEATVALLEKPYLEPGEVRRILHLAEEVRRRELRRKQQALATSEAPVAAGLLEALHYQGEEVHQADLYRKVLMSEKADMESVLEARFYFARYLHASRSREGDPFCEHHLLQKGDIASVVYPHQLLCEILKDLKAVTSKAMSPARVYNLLADILSAKSLDGAGVVVDDTLRSREELTKLFEKELGKRSLAFWEQERAQYPGADLGVATA